MDQNVVYLLLYLYTKFQGSSPRYKGRCDQVPFWTFFGVARLWDFPLVIFGCWPRPKPNFHRIVLVLMYYLFYSREIPHKFGTNIFVAHLDGHIPVILRSQPNPNSNSYLLSQHLCQMFLSPWPILVVPEMVTPRQPIGFLV